MSVYEGFSKVQLLKPKRSLFDLSHEKRLSTRMGRLTPIFISETMPNDTFRCNSEVMLRLAPMLAPIMHRIHVYVHFFFIPNRLLWKDWELFITGGRLGTETAPVPPRSLITTILGRAQNHLRESSLADYLGVPPIPDADTALWNGRTIDWLPFAACYKVWYDYYRNRNYVADNTILPLPSSSISDPTTIDELLITRFRHWERDYATSALPWTQRGNEVLMPLAGTGGVTYMGSSLVKTAAGGNPTANSLIGVDAITTPTGLKINKATAAGAGADGRIENINNVVLTTSDVSVNDWRLAIQLQSFLERNALAGSRYNESIMAHFARRTSDGRLQRAEYLGGGKVIVKVGEVLTTAWSLDGDDNDVPPADMAGRGISYGDTNRFTYNCEEHGFVVGFMSVLPTSGYMQGLPRMFRRRNTYLDYPWPSFAHLGEQPVYTNEIYAVPGTWNSLGPDSDTLFGYQSRYVDWKYIAPSAHGAFRTTLDFWHLTRKFSSEPVLGDTFDTFEDALQNRIFAVAGGVDTLWCYLYNQVTAIRSLPYYGRPATLA